MAIRSDHEKRGQSEARIPSKGIQSKKIIVLKLLARTPGHHDKIYKFDKERIVIGSVVSADIKLSGDGISPIHAVLERNVNLKTNRPHGTIYDLASDTGVFVNNKKIVAHQLGDQDEIVIGRHRFVFSLEEMDRLSSRDRVREAGDQTLFLNPNEDLSTLNLEDEREVAEIFDYRPTSKRALEVVMSWCGVILNVEHFVTERAVTIGNSRKSDFAIPATFSSNQYPIVIKRKGEFVLNLDGQMKGVMQRNGELDNLDAVRSTTVKSANGYEVPIKNSDFAKISIGEIDFYFSFTSAPPRLKRRRLLDRDPFFQRIFFLSMALTGILLFSLSKMDLPNPIEAEQVPERLATILYEPEKFLNPPPIPEVKPQPVLKEPPPQVALTPRRPEVHKALPKVMNVAQSAPEKSKLRPAKTTPAKPVAQNKPAPRVEAKEGEGAKAKGIEGSRGEKNRPKALQKVTELHRPSPHTGNKGASGNSQISDDGNVDLLKGAGGRIQNILGNSAAKLGKGSENLKGFGTFSTAGNGGLALSGNGTGGGGNAETSLGGLGKKGNGMGRVGTGKGAAGHGNGIVGSSVRVAIRTDGPEEAVVMGAIDRDAVAEAIYAHRDEFRLCYEREINAEHPTLAGQVGTSFVIGSSGRVTRAGIETTSLKNPNAERCILTVLKRIDFPIPRGGGVVEVRFPFKFTAAGKS